MNDKVTDLIKLSDKLEKPSFFSRIFDDQYQRMSSLNNTYDKIINIYLHNKKYEDASVYALKRLELVKKHLSDDINITKLYLQLGNIFQYFDVNKSIEYYKIAYENNIEENNTQGTITNIENIAKLYEKINCITNTIEWYMKIFDLNLPEIIEMKYLKLIAELYVKIDQFENAHQYYHKLVEISVGHDMGKYFIMSYLTLSLLCYMCNNNYDDIITKYNEYQETYFIFHDKFENKFLENLFDCVKNESLEKFQECVCDYNIIKTLSDIEIKILLKVKTNIIKNSIL